MLVLCTYIYVSLQPFCGWLIICLVIFIASLFEFPVFLFTTLWLRFNHSLADCTIRVNGPNFSSFYTVIYTSCTYWYVQFCINILKIQLAPLLLCCFYWSVLNHSGTILKNLGTYVHIHCTSHERWISSCRSLSITMSKKK